MIGKQQKPGGKPPAIRETVEMIDGRVYFSTDHWVTVWRQRRGTSHRVVTGEEAESVRYVAIMQAGGGN